MRKGVFTAAVAAAFLIGYFIGCSDELLPAAEGAQRYVYEVSEANLTGAGGYVNVSQVQLGTAGNGGANTPAVLVFGDGYGGNDRWRMLLNVELSQGKVKIDPNEYPSHYYRVIVIQ